jgi:hypothetical protein
MGTVYRGAPLNQSKVWDRPEFSSLSMLREACELLREAPPSLWQRHFIGVIPTIAGVLFFTLYFSTGQLHSGTTLFGALSMSILFFWLKGWQCAFTLGLLDLRHNHPHARTWRKWLGIFIFQGAHQAWGLFIIPLASLTFFPMVWVLAYFQSFTAHGDLPFIQAKKSALRQTMSGHIQQHFLASWLLLIFILTFLNVLSFGILLPTLVKMLFGVDSLFTRGGILTYFQTITGKFPDTFRKL